MCYSELFEFPLINWIKCGDGDLRWINKDRISRKEDVENWEKIYNKYIEKYRISESLNDYLEDKKRLIVLRNKYVQSGEPMLLNEIKMQEIELEEKDRVMSMNTVTIENTLPILSKWLGITLRLNDLTIVEYKNYVLSYEQSNK